MAICAARTSFTFQSSKYCLDFKARVALGCWDRKFGDGAAGADAPNLVAKASELGKPEIATGSSCDPVWAAIGCWDGILSDGAAGADAPNLVAFLFGKPEIATGSDCDPL